MAEFAVVGTRPDRVDGTEKVTGQAAFGADFRLPGLAYGKVLRAPHPRARMIRLDVRRARQHPGVLAVLTGADLPELQPSVATALGETSLDMAFLADMVLCRGEVRWKGHPVAAVAATSPDVAEAALGLIEVEYGPLPAVTDVLAAMAPDSPLVHPDIYTDLPGKQKAEQPSNVARYVLQQKGDVAQGFARADVVVEREYRTEQVHQGYIEPQSATAQVSPDGRMTIWTTTQSSFGVREQVSQVLQVPEAHIRVVPTEVGGAFGGKFYAYVEPLAAALSRAAGRPVRLTLSRSEVFEGTGPTPAAVMRIKLGARRSGELVAAQFWLAFDAGAYPGSAIGAGCGTGLAPYNIPHVKVEGFDVVTNKPRAAAYRAPGATQAAFAVESALDELIQALGADPVAFRLQNAAREGTTTHYGYKFQRVGFVELLEAVRAHPHWQSPLPDLPHVGRGFACGFWFNHGGQSACLMTINPDGSVNLTNGSIDLTGSRTALAQMVAEQLGVSVDLVNVRIPDTESVPYTEGTGGSRTTFATGMAVHLAAVEAREELRRRAARLLEAAEEDVEWAGGAFRVKGAPSWALTLRQVAAKQNQTGGPVSTRGITRGMAAAPAFSAALCDVQVDPDTGKVRILRYTGFQDVGKAIHPTYVEGQMQGGAVQGIGWALMEEYAWDGAVMRNPNMLDYRIPTALDLPNIDTCYVEVPAPGHPYGARGVGEAPIVPPPAAIANAVAAATGVRLQALPMMPERVWRALAGGRLNP